MRGRSTVILDGLDEIAEELRPVALQALNQASFRVVVLSRTAEMASAASQRGVLQGAAAVELRVVGPPTAAGYLERSSSTRRRTDGVTSSTASAPARKVLSAEALNNPLALTLIRDTYQSGDDARELLDFATRSSNGVSGAQAAEEITGHLLDRVLPAAYAPRPGQPPPRYDLRTAQNALVKIAARMNQDGTRDLQWWRIPGGRRAHRGSSWAGSWPGSWPGSRVGSWPGSRRASPGRAQGSGVTKFGLAFACALSGSRRASGRARGRGRGP